jgi:hypothetical protein
VSGQGRLIEGSVGDSVRRDEADDVGALAACLSDGLGSQGDGFRTRRWDLTLASATRNVLIDFQSHKKLGSTSPAFPRWHSANKEAFAGSSDPT